MALKIKHDDEYKKNIISLFSITNYWCNLVIL